MGLFGEKKSSMASGIAFIVTAVIAVLVSVCGGKADDSSNKIPKGAVQLNKTLTTDVCADSTMRRLDRDFEYFLRKWDIKGATLCIMRNDSLLYVHPFGEADEGQPMAPGNIMRVASVSKLVTATAIMLLQDQGLLSLDDTVFGEGDVLAEFRDVIKDRRYYSMTIRHLLMHEGGFLTRSLDPMFSTAFIMSRLGIDHAPSSEEIIRWRVCRPLSYAPGSSSSYSNFGFLLLSVLIERITGSDYYTWVNENVLFPAGCYDCHVAGNFYEDRLPGEVRYHAHAGDTPVPSFDGRGDVERCYGGNDVTALKGAGGWVMSIPELARFVASIDGRPGVPDIISPEAVAQMTFCTDSVTFGLGWNDCSGAGVWTRTGTLSSTSALIKYYGDGECWILCTNTGTYRGPHFTKYISTMFTRSREKYSASLPERDLFQASL